MTLVMKWFFNLFISSRSLLFTKGHGLKWNSLMEKKWKVNSFIISLKLSKKSLNNKGFILPYTLLLLMVVLLFSVSTKEIFVSKYHYLTNIKKLSEREVSVLHGVMVQIEENSIASQEYEGSFGEITMNSQKVNEKEMKIEIVYKQQDEVFLPVTVVYNSETKKIIDWK